MSPFKEDSKIWMNGKLVLWKDATIHIASHVIHYGTSIFEGFRNVKNGFIKFDRNLMVVEVEKA